MTSKLFYEDQYLKKTVAHVVEKTKKGDTYIYKLDQTIFYPEGGGQPSDRGWMNGFEVLDVYEHDNEIFHVIKEDIEAKQVELKLDWDFRFQAMQGHLAQHLLSAIIERKYEMPTMSHHYGKISTVDVKGEVANLDLVQVENLCNESIRNACKVSFLFPTEEELASMNLIDEVKVTENIRVVHIEDIDNNPCGGLHCGNLAELQLLKILSVETIKGGMRISFVSGHRALADYDMKHKQVSSISQKISQTANEISSGVENLLERMKVLEETVEKCKTERNINKVEELKSSSPSKVINVVLSDFDTKDATYICNQFVYDSGYFGFIGCALDDRTHFFIFKSKDVSINLRPTFMDICSKYSLRGGGNDNLLQAGSKEPLPLHEINELITLKFEEILSK
ncbi:MAG: threonyl and Alanyl tRNA synthetase second additional domain protein [Bacillales bacterium]|nr:threonyl and Alanyl tRNA synthetase second additional domain protein [Bacillales bacterium]